VDGAGEEHPIQAAYRPIYLDNSAAFYTVDCDLIHQNKAMLPGGGVVKGDDEEQDSCAETATSW
jgi:hypothetical protein